MDSKREQHLRMEQLKGERGRPDGKPAGSMPRVIGLRGYGGTEVGPGA